MLRASAQRLPAKEALVHGARRMTYGEVAKAVDGLAYGLRTAGLERGDRIGIFLEPSIPQALSIFAASKANAVFVPINHLFHPDQVLHIMTDCRMKALITTEANLSNFSPVFKQVPSLSFIVSVG